MLEDDRLVSRAELHVIVCRAHGATVTMATSMCASRLRVGEKRVPVRTATPLTADGCIGSVWLYWKRLPVCPASTSTASYKENIALAQVRAAELVQLDEQAAAALCRQACRFSLMWVGMPYVGGYASCGWVVWSVRPCA